MQNYVRFASDWQKFKAGMDRGLTTQNKKTVQGIPEPTIRRMPLYLAYLKTIDTKEKKHISAPGIAKDLGLPPPIPLPQVRLGANSKKGQAGPEVA